MLDTISIKELAQLLECPVCLKNCETDCLVQCKNGHSGCETCFSKLSTCPICREKLTAKIKTISDEMSLILKQELRHVEDAAGTINLSRLMEFLRCAACRYWPTQYVSRQCVNGHLLCQKCNAPHSKCPTCLARRDDLFSIRSLKIQKILEITAKPCRYKRYGCKVVITDLNKHESDGCVYKEIRCIFANCSSQFSRISLLDHLKEFNPNHHNLILPLQDSQNRSQGCLDLPSNWQRTFEGKKWNKIDYLKLENHDLFFVCFADFIQTTFFVYYLGDQKESKKFGYKLRLYNEDREKDIEVIGPAISVDVHYNFMFLNAFHIFHSEVKTYWQQTKIRLLWDATVFEDKSSTLNDTFISIKTPSGEWRLAKTDDLLYR